jgi:heptaprenyl diphosphate synthase
LAEKTGSLIATSGHLGALLAGGTPEQVDALTRFGDLFGVAFQLSDDIIDLSSASADSGKTPGTDLREGVPTLPVLLALASADTPPELRALLSAPVADDDIDAVLAQLAAHPAMAEAQETVRRWAREAAEALEVLPDSPAREALRSLCGYVVDRVG